MKQSNNRKNRDTTIAMYLRITREDADKENGYKDESNSIVNQRKLLTGIAKSKGFTNMVEFVDDGITGTSRDRDDFNKMIAAIESGNSPFTAVIVKDLSRFARDHIRADMLIEEVFPLHDIRLISVSEGLDSANGEDEFTPFRNLMNEWYARDISKKRKLTNVVKGNAGEPLSPPPYGYVKNPENPKHWVIEPEAAEIVHRIFGMYLDGKGTEQIAIALTAEKILNPTHYWKNRGVNRGGLKAGKEPHFWNSSAVKTILDRQEYCGDVINFKTYSKSFKLKKRIANKEENMVIRRDVHECIIDRATWERVQERHGNSRKRPTRDGEKNMFSGLLFCSDCGYRLNYHFNQKNHDIKYFNCSGYNSRLSDCPTTHYIRVDFLEQVILGEIHRLTRYASKHESVFAQFVMGYAQESDVTQREKKSRELAAMRSRDKELDKLFNKMYEDNVSGKIDDERFARMSRQYTIEQKELADKMASLGAEIDKMASKTVNTDMFISTVRKYTRAKKLTERMLVELIDRIEVHQSEKVDGVFQQKLTIYYNCIGAIEIPDELAIPQAEVLINTRKGVAVSYLVNSDATPTSQQAIA